MGSPKVCNSTLLGTTRDNSQLNTTDVEHTREYITGSLGERQSVTVDYVILNNSPQQNYTFTAYVLDYFNNSKTKNESSFSECTHNYDCNNNFITIATFHVQGLTLQYYSDNGSVVVECRFAERSTADGCHVIFRESSKGTVKSINITKSSIEESTVYQYITLPVSGNYTVRAHDIVDGTVTTNPSVVYPQVLRYVLIPSSPTEIVINTSKYYIVLFIYIS